LLGEGGRKKPKRGDQSQHDFAHRNSPPVSGTYTCSQDADFTVPSPIGKDGLIGHSRIWRR
jgi:hypothetical protein